MNDLGDLIGTAVAQSSAGILDLLARLRVHMNGRRIILNFQGQIPASCHRSRFTRQRTERLASHGGILHQTVQSVLRAAQKALLQISRFFPCFFEIPVFFCYL